MADLVTFIVKTAQLTQDTAGLLTTGAGGDLEESVRDALERYSRDEPQTLMLDLPGDGATYEYVLPATFSAGHSRVLSIEYPLSDRWAHAIDEHRWMLYRAPDGWRLRLTEDTPTPGETVRVLYSAPQTIAGLDGALTTTIPPYHTQAFIKLAAAHALTRLANRFLHEQEAALGLDSVNRSTKADQARRLAAALDAAYQAQVGAPDSGVAPAMTWIRWQHERQQA